MSIVNLADRTDIVVSENPHITGQSVKLFTELTTLAARQNL